MPNRTLKGFSLLEVLLAISILTIIAGIFTPIYGYFYNRNNLDLAAQQTVQSIRHAQILAKNSERDADWGVYLNSNLITVFKGGAYLTRDTLYDESEGLPGGTTASLPTEIVFSKASGTPKTFPSITLSQNNESKIITINSQGIISY